jgi:hypothetical protein
MPAQELQYQLLGNSTTPSGWKTDSLALAAV